MDTKMNKRLNTFVRLRTASLEFLQKLRKGTSGRGFRLRSAKTSGSGSWLFGSSGTVGGRSMKEQKEAGHEVEKRVVKVKGQGGYKRKLQQHRTLNRRFETAPAQFGSTEFADSFGFNDSFTLYDKVWKKKVHRQYSKDDFDFGDDISESTDESDELGYGLEELTARAEVL